LLLLSLLLTEALQLPIGTNHLPACSFSPCLGITGFFFYQFDLHVFNCAIGLNVILSLAKLASPFVQLVTIFFTSIIFHHSDITPTICAHLNYSPK